MDFDAGTKPFASIDAPSFFSRRRRERRECARVCVCILKCVICIIKYTIHVYINDSFGILAFCCHLYQLSLPCFSDELATA